MHSQRVAGNSRRRLLLRAVMTLAGLSAPLCAVRAQSVAWAGPTDIAVERLCDYCRTSASDAAGNVATLGTGYNGTNGAQYILALYFSANGTLAWQRTVGYGYAYGAAMDPSGNVLITGWSEADPVPTGMSISKYTPAGDLAWGRNFLSPFHESSGIASDASGNVYVVGRRGSRMFVIKHDAAGTFQWATDIDVDDSRGRAIVVDPGGESVVVGQAGPDAAPATTIVAKLDAGGTVVWQRTASIAQHVYDLAVDSVGNPVVAGGNADAGFGSGTFRVLKYSSAGDFLWTRDLPLQAGRAYAVAVDSADHVVAAGTIDYPAFRSNLVVTKYDPAGELLWYREQDTAGVVNGNGPAQDVLIGGGDDVTVAGYSSRDPGYVVTRYNAAGELMWDTRIIPPSVPFACAFDLAPGLGESVYVSGIVNGCTVGGGLQLVNVRNDTFLLNGFEG
ncbi:MAG TPA: hypothetical protein PLC02_13695 [Pseudomonadota bacterium]|nr:hypothetical protein [Pseudomonadota bacterium]